MSPSSHTSDRSRDTILKAALEEFRSHGFDAASLDRIATTAGVSRRTVRKHFADKDALFSALLHARCSPDLTELAYQPDRPLRDQLLALLQQKMRVLDDGAFIDLRQPADPLPDDSDHDETETETAWFRAAMADRKLKPVDPRFAAHQLRGLLKGLAFWSPAKREPMVTSAVERFLGCYA